MSYAYRIVQKRTDLERNPKCDGYDTEAHRAPFVYIIRDMAYCPECYERLRSKVKKIMAFEVKH